MALKKHLWKALERVKQNLGPEAYDILSVAIQTTPDYIMVGTLTQLDRDAPTLNIKYTNFPSPLTFEYISEGTYRIDHPIFSSEHTILFTGSNGGKLLSYAAKNNALLLLNNELDGTPANILGTISFKLEIYVDPEHYISK